MNIIIIDDDKMIVNSLEIILGAQEDITVIAKGFCGEDAVSLYEQYNPDILLIDIQMPGIGGLCAAETILKKDAHALILFLTTFSDNEYIAKALQLGVKGYILKQDFASIYPALKAVMSGQSVFGSDIVQKIPALWSNKNSASYEDYGLNQKEWSFIEQVARGLNNKEIAETLFLSEGTVRNYISVILEKLELRDRTQLAIFYYKGK